MDALDDGKSRQKEQQYNGWQFWQQHNKPIEILDSNMFHQKLEYIHRKPVVSGFVKNEEDWLYRGQEIFTERED
jgi:hypothetical protein